MRIIAGIFVTLAAALLAATAPSRVALASSDEPEKTVQIVLYPAAEPCPALKYQLLPPFLERRPGNAAVWWNRLPAERANYLSAADKEFATSGKFTVWMDMPIGSPQEKAYRKKELASVVNLIQGGGIFSDMARAAQFESCDWEQPIREGNYIAVLLPEIQHARAYARLLSAKAHLEIAEGKYNEAVKTLQIGYAQARHVAQSQTLVSGIVGVTIASIMSHQVEQFVQQSDSPNLYWALSTLPRPLVDMRPGGEAESNILYLQFPELRDLDKKKLAPDEWRELLKRIVGDILKFSDNRDFPRSGDTAAMIAMAGLQGYPRAKQYLIDKGRTAAEVNAMPVAQVILLYTVQIYNEASDDQFKWYFVPGAEAARGQEQAERHFDATIRPKEIIPVAALLLPASRWAKEAETRCEWTVAVLRILEAMRLYAANHEGQWPDSLSDITEVPIPKNPYDGGNFIYHREGNKAVLTAEMGPRNWHQRYEITLKAKGK
jgi:hypothetical protein